MPALVVNVGLADDVCLGLPSKIMCFCNWYTDPGEHYDLAFSQPALAQNILDRMKNAQTKWFNPDRGDPHPLACEIAERTGFWGPFLT